MLMFMSARPSVGAAVGAAVIGLLAGTPQAHAQAVPVGTVVKGHALVTDGDRITLPGVSTTIRLWGIDAPSVRQPCTLQGQTWACGGVSTRSLEILVDLGETTCTIVEERNPRRRAFTWATCEVGGLDLGAEMVRTGWALSFPEQTNPYAPFEEQAHAAGEGLWKSEFQPPWQWDEEHLLE